MQYNRKGLLTTAQLNKNSTSAASRKRKTIRIRTISMGLNSMKMEAIIHLTMARMNQKSQSLNMNPNK